MAKVPAPPLVLRFGAFGDMLLLLPFLRALRQRYGAACDVVASGPWTPPVLGGEESVASLRLLSSRRAPYWFNRDQQRFVAWLRRRPPGPVYLCEGDRKSEALVRRAGVPAAWTCNMRDFPAQPGENILDRFQRFAQATPAALCEQPPPPVAVRPPARPAASASAAADLAAWLAGRGLAGKSLVLVQPGNKRTMRRGARSRGSNLKYWPEERWAEVIRGVCDSMPDARVLICGSAQESGLAADILGRCDAGRVQSAAGDLPIPRLLALLELAHSMISVDTGPAHAAAATGCPLVVLFASPDTAYYAPTANGAAVESVVPTPGPGDPYPMQSVTPAAVLAAWRRLPS